MRSAPFTSEYVVAYTKIKYIIDGRSPGGGGVVSSGGPEIFCHHDGMHAACMPLFGTTCVQINQSIKMKYNRLSWCWFIWPPDIASLGWVGDIFPLPCFK